jgi:acetyl-CoA C-acetyltransferase
MRQDPIVIVGAKRTPIGAFQGELSALTAPELGAAALAATWHQSGLDSQRIDEVYMGCVLPAGQGQAPTRQAALKAGLSPSTGCTTVQKVCGSGMKAIMLGHDGVIAGSSAAVLCGGMESMSQAPYLLPKARSGLRLGHHVVQDHMFLDGLEDSYGGPEQGRLMGTFAEDCALAFGFSREVQDAYARLSTERAQAAWRDGAFAVEVTPVRVPTRQGHHTVETDETPFKVQLDRIAQLRPAFRPDGTVTAANASSIADGAAALLLMRESAALGAGAAPLARIIASAGYAGTPGSFPTAPIAAIEALFVRCGWHADDVDLFEINEAFAVVVLAAMRALRLDPNRVNVHGGACALGHPIGASGARIVVTLLYALIRHGLRRGVASLCIGGGEATALAIERLA